MTAARDLPPALLIKPMPGRRAVTAAVSISHGGAHDPADLAGATHLVEHLTLRRCGGRDRLELAQLVDRLGGDVDAWTDAEAMGVSVQTTVDAVAEALDLLVDAVMDPTFERVDVDLERRVTEAELELAADDPADRVEEALLVAAWGDHPLARPIIGTRRTLRRLTAERLREHHRRLVAPGRLLLAVAGDVDPRLVADRCSRLPLGGVPVAPTLEAPTWHGRRRRLSRPRSEQVHVRLGLASPTVGDVRLPALVVLNRLLGVGASSRLFQRLREDEGLTYDVWSGLVLRRPAGLLEVGWACGPSALAETWAVAMETLRMLAATITADEVAVAREGLVRGLEMDAESTAGWVSLDAGEVLDYGRRFDPAVAVAELEGVTLETVRRLADEVVRLDRMASAICGPADAARQVA